MFPPCPSSSLRSDQKVPQQTLQKMCPIRAHVAQSLLIFLLDTNKTALLVSSRGARIAERSTRHFDSSVEILQSKNIVNFKCSRHRELSLDPLSDALTCSLRGAEWYFALTPQVSTPRRVLSLGKEGTFLPITCTSTVLLSAPNCDGSTCL